MVEYAVIENEKLRTQTNDNIVNLTLQTIELGKQVLIFNNSKRSSESTAKKVALAVKNIDNKHELEKISMQVLKAVSTPTKQCRTLSDCVLKGVAFHHSGLAPKQRSLIEKGFKLGFIKIISSTPTLCLAKGTQVWTGDEKISIEKLKNKNVFALKGNILKPIKIEKVENNGLVNEAIEIETVSGHKIKSTINHKFLIKKKNKKLLLKANDLSKNDLIATIGNLNVKDKNIKFSNIIKDNIFPFKNRSLLKEEFYFIGAMLGDGYSGAEIKKNKIIYKGSPCIVGIDKEVFNIIDLVCKKLDVSIRYSKNSYQIPQLILGKNKWFREFMVRCGVDLGINKFILKDIKFSSKKNLVFLLRGLFDTDGCVELRGNIGYSSISKKLIKDIQDCLYRFNIVSRIREKTKKNIRINDKEYKCKNSYELLISENTSILNFQKFIGFNIKRKKESLNLIVDKINSNLLSKKCVNCGYILYKDLFSGRTREQKVWGKIKYDVIKILYDYGSLPSSILKNKLNLEIRKNSFRLNHHYELIDKKKLGSHEWIWSLNKYGTVLAKELKKSSFEEIFLNKNCLSCGKELKEIKKKTWKDSNKEEDIYWDQIRSIKKIKEEIEVYDVVLPSDGLNDHLFVAEGFITHNSAGLNLPAYKVIIKDYKRYSQRGFNDIPILEFHQMSGRAGRPGIEQIGKSVLCVKTDDELDRVVPKYVFGKPEEIISKLAVEPTLKMYMLSLVAMDLINTKKEIVDFFSNTFYAHQYQDIDSLKYNLFRILDILKDYDFIHQDDDYFVATQIGKKVSELYLNPDTANYFLENFDKFIKRFNTKYISKNDIFSLIFFVVNTTEMKPLFRVSKFEEDNYVSKAESIGDELIVGFDPFEIDYANYLNSLKTTDVLMDWISEAHEEYLNEKYKVTPGELYYKKEVIDWLLYCLEEISILKKNFFLRNFLNKLRIRFKHGIGEELLTLISIKGVGRVRARKLYRHGFKKLFDLKKADFDQIARVVGEATAIKIKEQVSTGFQDVNQLLDKKPREIKVREVSDIEVETLVQNYQTFEKEKKEMQKGLNEFF